MAKSVSKNFCEIGTEQEAFAARTIAERGVQLVGTAHGNTLENLLMNPTLSDLIGGIQAVTLSDDEAKRRGTQKTVLERKSPPTFDVIVEIMEVDKLAIHINVEKTVDRMLRGGSPRPEIRIRNAKGEIEVIQHSDEVAKIVPIHAPEHSKDHPDRYRSTNVARVEPEARTTKFYTNSTLPAVNEEAQPPLKLKSLPDIVRIFPYGVSRSRLDRAVMEARVPVLIARDIGDADAIVALKATLRSEPNKMREAIQRRLPVYSVKSNTYSQIFSCIQEIFKIGGNDSSPEQEDEAMLEAQDGVDRVKLTNLPAELKPTNAFTRRLQHLLVERHQLTSESVGAEPQRRVRILPSVAA